MSMNKSAPQPLSPNPDHVYMKFEAGGQTWVSPEAARKHVERGEARPIDPPKQDTSASR